MMNPLDQTGKINGDASRTALQQQGALTGKLSSLDTHPCSFNTIWDMALFKTQIHAQEASATDKNDRGLAIPCATTEYYSSWHCRSCIYGIILSIIQYNPRTVDYNKPERPDSTQHHPEVKISRAAVVITMYSG
ncbi:hypothetical protein FPOAC2_12246 [Fusarium poae]